VPESLPLIAQQAAADPGVAESDQLTLPSSVAQARILAGHPQHSTRARIRDAVGGRVGARNGTHPDATC
jgi:hypothetical protein